MHEYEPASFRQSFERNQDKKKRGGLREKISIKAKRLWRNQRKIEGKERKKRVFLQQNKNL